jgi:hypothetical protein
LVASRAEIVGVSKRQCRPGFPLRLFNLTTPAVLLNRGYPAEQVRFFEPRAERLIQLQTPIIRVPDATENHVRKLPSRCKPVSLMNDPGTLGVDQP